MAKFIGRYVSPEMLALGLLELMLTFALAYILLMPTSAGLVLELKAANHALILALTIGFTAFTIGVYRPQIFLRARSLLVNTVLSGLLAFPAVWVVSKAIGLSSYWPVGYDALRPVKILAIWIGALVAIRFLFLVAVRLNLFVHRVAILGQDEVPNTVAAIRAGRKGFLEVAIPRAGTATPASLQAARVRSVIFAAGALDALPPATREDYAFRGIRTETEAEFWERHLKRVDIDNLQEAWIATLGRQGQGGLQRVFNRTGDIAISLVFLIATLPLMLVVALMVRLDSPGPVLYRQERVGLGGRTFTLFKFRSMRANAEARGPAWAQQRDPRVTRVGSFMRRTRIDELPQLFNVLRGEMGFIGPRPERPHFVEQLAEAIPHYRERARVKPGLTGWAQVNYPYGASVEDARAKLSYDLYYVQHRNPLLDILILFATVRVILFQEGAR